jgi:hypothetical protein
MRFTVSTILVISVFPTVTVQAFFGGFFFNLLFRPLIQSTCDDVQDALGLGAVFDCECDVSYQGLFQGVSGMVDCGLTGPPRCLVPPDLYCANGDVEADVKASLFSNAGLTSDVTANFNVSSGLPQDVGSFVISFDFVANGLKFTECGVTIGNTTCNSCKICDPVAFKFNCTNVNLWPNNSTFVPGPAVDTCIGLSLGNPTNTTRRY